MHETGTFACVHPGPANVRLLPSITIKKYFPTKPQRWDVVMCASESPVSFAFDIYIDGKAHCVILNASAVTSASSGEKSTGVALKIVTKL